MVFGVSINGAALTTAACYFHLSLIVYYLSIVATPLIFCDVFLEFQKIWGFLLGGYNFTKTTSKNIRQDLIPSKYLKAGVPSSSEKKISLSLNCLPRTLAVIIRAEIFTSSLRRGYRAHSDVNSTQYISS